MSEVHLLDVGVISIHVHHGRSKRVVCHRAQKIARERTSFEWDFDQLDRRLAECRGLLKGCDLGCKSLSESQIWT